MSRMDRLDGLLAYGPLLSDEDVLLLEQMARRLATEEQTWPQEGHDDGPSPRDQVIKVRLSVEERTVLQRAADHDGEAISTWIRRGSLGRAYAQGRGHHGKRATDGPQTSR